MENRRKLRLLFWESTIRCNLSCAHCRRIAGDKSADRDLTTVQAKQMIDQLTALGIHQDFLPVVVFSGGEPLLRGDIFELCEYATTSKLKCALATNGTLIDEANAKKLKAAGVTRVAVSLDGATSQIHNKLRQLEGSFEAALCGIDCLRRSGVEFQINMTMSRYNVHQLEDIFQLAHNLEAAAVHLFMLVPVGCGQEFKQDDMLSADEYERLLANISKMRRSDELEIKVTCGPHYERVIRQQDSKLHMSKGCLAGSGILFVSHDGTVFPCGYLPVNCGNITQKPLVSIWNESQELALLRDAEKLKGKCGICEYRVVCGGCRARAYAATGDCMQSEPMCTYVPGSETHKTS